MAKKLAADMTAEELEARHAKAAQKRADRRQKQLEAIAEITALLSPEQLKSLSENAQHQIAVWSQEYKPAARINITSGMSLMQLLAEHPNLSAKKLKARCADAGLTINWAKGIIE